MVGDGHRFLPQIDGPCHERVDLGETVEEAELGVGVQVREHRMLGQGSKAPGARCGRLCEARQIGRGAAQAPPSPPATGSSNWKAACSTWTARRPASSWTRAVMRISLVVMSSMLTPASARARNMVLA